MRHFESYIMNRLFGEYSFCYTRPEAEMEELNSCMHLPPSTTSVHHGAGQKERRGKEWVISYLRMKHVIVFRMSHDAIQVSYSLSGPVFNAKSLIVLEQFNFYDHTKIVLSQAGLRVTYIDKAYQMSSWTLSEVLGFNLGLGHEYYGDFSHYVST